MSPACSVSLPPLDIQSHHAHPSDRGTGADHSQLFKRRARWYGRLRAVVQFPTRCHWRVGEEQALGEAQGQEEGIHGAKRDIRRGLRAARVRYRH